MMKLLYGSELVAVRERKAMIDAGRWVSTIMHVPGSGVYTFMVRKS